MQAPGAPQGAEGRPCKLRALLREQGVALASSGRSSASEAALVVDGPVEVGQRGPRGFEFLTEFVDAALRGRSGRFDDGVDRGDRGLVIELPHRPGHPVGGDLDGFRQLSGSDSVHVLSPAAVMVTVVGAVGVLAFRDGLVVAGAGADSAALGGASVAGRAFRDGRAEFDSSTSVFDDDVGCGFGGAGSGVRRRTAAVAVVAVSGR